MTVDAAPPRRDRSHLLYLSVLVAMALGILIGFLFPDFAVKLRPLGTAVGQLANTRASAYRTYRTGLGADGTDLPDSFTEVITAVTTFADPLLQGAPRHTWSATAGGGSERHQPATRRRNANPCPWCAPGKGCPVTTRGGAQDGRPVEETAPR